MSFNEQHRQIKDADDKVIIISAIFIMFFKLIIEFGWFLRK